MSTVRDMAPCPTCGAMLDVRLVAAIKDPGDPEAFCPRGPRPVAKAQPVMTQKVVRRVADLASLMILGAMVRSMHESGYSDDDEEMPEAA